jgi:hypothetical protein
MPHNSSRYAFVFPLETSFQKMARRPGGIPREQALRNAKTEVLRLFIRCIRPAAPVRAAVPLRRPPGIGYLPMASGFKFD